MRELPAGLLETSSGLAVLSALFLLAALHSWWQARRSRRARAKLHESEPGGRLARPSTRPTPDDDRTPELPKGNGTAAEAQPPASEDRDEPTLEIDPVRPDAALDAADDSEEEGAVDSSDELGLSDDDAAELVPRPAERTEPAVRQPSPALEEDRIRRLEALVEQGELQEASEILAELGDEARNDRRASRCAGRLALRRGKPAQSIPLLEACLEHDPQDLETRLDVCAAHAELGNFEGVLRHARRGLEARPKDGRLLVHLSEAAFELGAPEEALELANRAFRTRREPASFFHVARLRAMCRRLTPNDAGRLREALERYPGQPALLHAAGVYEAMYGRPAAALRILRSAAEREPTTRHRRAIEREIDTLRAAAHTTPADSAA